MTTLYSRSQAASEGTQPALPVGQKLRLQREQLGWSLPEIAGWLRIRLGYLQALEDGRPQDLPGSTYAIGFLRSYATALGLDAQDLARRLRQEARGLERRPDLNFPSPVPERRVPAGAAVLTGIVLLGLTYAGWYSFGDHGKLPEQVLSPVPANLASYVGDQPHLAPPSPQVAPLSPGLSTGTPPMTRTASGPPQPYAAGPPMPVPAAVPVVAPSPVPAPPQISVHASATSWVQVRQEGGPVVYEHVLASGESWSVPPGRGNLLLSTGNAGGIVLDVDGTSTPLLGRPGTVRRNLPLTLSAIRNGSLLEGPPAVARLPIGNPTGQNPPFLAGSGREALTPGQNGGQPYPEH